MLRKLFTNLLIGGALFGVGAALAVSADAGYVCDGYSRIAPGLSCEDFFKGLGAIIAFGGGLGYPIIATVVALKPLAEKVVRQRDQNRAQEELLKYKKLLDEGILTQDEYARKAEELKKQIL